MRFIMYLNFALQAVDSIFVPVVLALLARALFNLGSYLSQKARGY